MTVERKVVGISVKHNAMKRTQKEVKGNSGKEKRETMEQKEENNSMGI